MVCGMSNHTPTVIRVRDGADLLALIPHQIGFTPRDCVVVMGVSGGRGALGMTVRLDLEQIRHPKGGPPLGAYIGRLMVDDGAVRAVIVRYHGIDDPPARLDTAVRGFVGAIAAKMEEIQLWDVGLTRYQRLDERTWRPRGESGPLERVLGTIPAATMAALGSAPAPSRQDVAPLPVPDPIDLRRARRAAARAQDQAARAGAAGISRWRQQMLDGWRNALRPMTAAIAQGRSAEPPDWRVTGEIAAGLSDPVVRDAILTALVHDGEIPDLIVAAGYDSEARAKLGNVLDPREGATIDPDVGTAAEALLAFVAAHAIARRRGQVFGVMAWLAWTLGDGVKARLACTRAQACPGDVLLTEIVQAMMGEAITPRRADAARRRLAGAPTMADAQGERARAWGMTDWSGPF
jgi:hypothetical protein